MKNQHTKNKGFTLIELMVATSIFVIVMLTSMSSLFILLDSAKSSRALRFAMDNVNFSMDSMTRSIRMGTNYYCGGGVSMTDLNSFNDCPNDGGTAISFVPQEDIGSRVGYKWTSRINGSHTLQRYGTGGWVDIVSDDVDIERLIFFVKGSTPVSYMPQDNEQASVYIIMKGTVMTKNGPTSFAIQTMASQRNF